MAGNRKEFDRSLERIEAKVIALFAIIAENLPAATRALLGDGTESVTALARREQLVDALYVEVEKLAGREILLQAPVAADLRFLLTVLRVVPELERSHDLVMDLASRAARVRAADLLPAVREPAVQMAELACGMWRQAADAWYGRDRSAATALSEQDAMMAELDNRLTSEIAEGQMPVTAIMDMTQVTRDYRRLGAHAVNVTRRVAYLAGNQG